MKKSTIEIRQMFLNYFQNKGHSILSSSSLLLKDDPSLLFTNSGMNQFKNIFLGLEKNCYSRVTTSQRCIRAGGKHNDLEKVGYTTRHHTFFEMLGNFSFGDYFKEGAIEYAWELLTDKEWFNLPKERLWITVYETDDETYEIWKKKIGIDNKRIIRIGDKKGVLYSSDNFWQMSDTGPCGPCTEIFYDQGDHILGELPGSSEKDNNRYVEIWNIVFIQFNRRINGVMEPLVRPFVDTGMGLERIAAVLQCVNSNYEIDLFRKLIGEVMKVTGATHSNNKSLRVIADHIRSCVFLIADGVIPSNENHGYVLRRIIRRAIRHGNILGSKEIFFYKLVNPLINIMGTTAEYLNNHREYIEKILKNEEEQFIRTLKRGLILLNKKIKDLQGNILDGKTVFRLYDTYGFPIDLIEDVCYEHNVKIDEVGFKLLMEEQRCRSRRFSKFNTSYKDKKVFIDNISKFYGYDHLVLDSNITALIINNKIVDNVSFGQEATVFLNRTPFYPESGGQVGDHGELKNNNFTFIVKDTKRYGRAIGHIGELISESEPIEIGNNVKAVVNKIHRTRICLNHSATHIMYAALKQVIGEHVTQKGSLINEKILRFDFSHFKAMKPEEIRAVENLVNFQIRRNLLIKSDFINLEEAKLKGIIPLFSNKYEEYIRVLNIGDFSTEFCVGTHTLRTGDIGFFSILSESSIAAGIRRIEAVTGENAINSVHMKNDQLYFISKLLKVETYNLNQKVQYILEHTLQLEKKIQQLKEYIIKNESERLSKSFLEIKGIKLIVSELIKVDSEILRAIADNLKKKLNSTVIVLATVIKSQIFLVVGISQDMLDRIQAKELINMIAKKIDGRGGGRSDIAQAGGKNIKALSQALFSVKKWISRKL